ncbi:MAG: argininosuccinate lyase [Nitrososphaeria archaeon]
MLRGRRLDPMDDLALRITSSAEADRRIQSAVVYVNMAHVVGLYNAGAISKEVMNKLMQGLSNELSGYPISYKDEDVHMSLEKDLALKVGLEAGFIGLAKSRNDQVATAIRLQLRQELLGVMENVLSLIEAITGKASESIRTFFITFTHLQPAQASTGAHWLLSYAWSFLRDLERLKLAYQMTDMSPLGSAASAGSIVQVDRYFEAEALGFSGIVENTIDAVSTRDFIFDSIYAMSSAAVNLSRLSADIVAYMALGLIDLDDRYVSTSSLMPQKRNTVVAEIVRAKSANIISNLLSAMEIVRGLNLSYNLDLQEITPKVWASIDEINDMLKATAIMIGGLKFNEDRAKEMALKGLVTASDVAEYVSIKYGIAFREAHHMVGEAVRNCGETYVKCLVDTLKSMGINVDVEELSRMADPISSVERRSTTGGPHPRESLRQISAIELKVKEFEDFLGLNSRKIEKTYQSLINRGWY